MLGVYGVDVEVMVVVESMVVVVRFFLGPCSCEFAQCGCSLDLEWCAVFC